MDKSRSMLNCTDLGKEFWGHAVLTAAYLLNRSPSRAINFKVPAEIWYGKWDLKKIRVFGCKCFYKRLNMPKGSKVEDRSKEARFIGYVDNGWRLWDMEERKEVVARNIVFIEKPIINNLNVVSTVGNRDNMEDKIIREEENNETERIESKDESVSGDNESDVEEVVPDLEPEEEVRQERPVRKRVPPSCLKDYVLVAEGESTDFESALRSTEAKEWKAAMKEEIDSIAKNEEFHRRTKHIDVRVHFLREKVAEGVLELEHIEGSKQPADILTKALQRQRFEHLRSLIGISVRGSISGAPKSDSMKNKNKRCE